jgi:hypothetical protein
LQRKCSSKVLRFEIKSGEQWGKWCSAPWKVLIKEGELRLLPFPQAKNLTVYAQQELALAVGDSVRIAKNF